MPTDILGWRQGVSFKPIIEFLEKKPKLAYTFKEIKKGTHIKYPEVLGMALFVMLKNGQLMLGFSGDEFYFYLPYKTQKEPRVKHVSTVPAPTTAPSVKAKASR